MANPALSQNTRVLLEKFAMTLENNSYHSFFQQKMPKKADWFWGPELQGDSLVKWYLVEIKLNYPKLGSKDKLGPELDMWLKMYPHILHKQMGDHSYPQWAKCISRALPTL